MPYAFYSINEPSNHLCTCINTSSTFKMLKNGAGINHRAKHFTCFITFFQKKSIYVVWFRCNIPLLVCCFFVFFVFFKVNTIIKLTEKYNIHRVIYCTCFSRVAHYSIDLPGIFVLSYDLVTNSYRHTKFNVRKEKFSLLSSAESNHRK